MLNKILKREREKRKYIRYPAEVSIEYKISGEKIERSDYTKNISFGGLCFHAKSYIKPGTVLTLKFPTINLNSEIVGEIVWCSGKKEEMEIGVKFRNENDAFRARIIEEICHLKNYQRQFFEKNSGN
jgi:hypothetical protein